MSTKDDFDQAKDDFDKAATAWDDINDALRAMKDCMARAQCDPPHPAMIACFDALRDAFSQAADDFGQAQQAFFSAWAVDQSRGR